MSILGVNVGYKNTKTTGEMGSDIFSSTVRRGTEDFNSSIKLSYMGEDYTVGDEIGSVSVGLDKINDETFNICFLAAIARNMKGNVDNNLKIVTGLPIDYYSGQKDKLIEKFKGLKATVLLNDLPKSFTITDILVFPESAGLMLLEPNKFIGDNIVIDIGGLTVCVSYFKGMKLLKHKTYELGMLKLYDKIVQKIKKEHKVSYDPLFAEDIIKTKKIIVNGYEQPVIALVNNELKKHTTEILQTVELGLTEYQTSIRHFIGGGSITLREYLNGTMYDHSIYTNSKAFYRLGVNKFES